MATKKAAENDVSLPFPALQLVAPPVRLVSAAVWQAVQRRDVLQYGAVEEFVTSVCESVPGVLTFRHQGKLTLGLRGRLILELLSRSQARPDRESIQRHMERFRTPAPCPTGHKLKRDVKIETTVSCFQELVETLLQDSAVRLQFFEEEFPEEYGSKFDQDLEKLLWEFLIRLDQLLPVPNLAQTVSWLSTAPPVLEECARAATQPQLLKTILQFQTCLGHLEAAASLPPKMGDSIMTSLSLPLSGRPAPDRPSPSDRPAPSDRPSPSDRPALPGADAAQGEEGSRRRDGVKRKQPGSGGGREDTSSTEEEEEEADGEPSWRGGSTGRRRRDKKGRWVADGGSDSPPAGPFPRTNLSPCFSLLLHQPTVLLRRLDAATLSAADANTEDRREEKSTPKSVEGTPRRRGAEPSCSDDKENCHVLPGITTPTITEARPSAGDSDDVIGDSEDEATKNFKGMVSWLSTAPPVLEECARAATQPQLLKTILQFQTCLGHLEAAASLPPKMGDSIMTSLSLPLSGRPAPDRPSPSDRPALLGAGAAQGKEGSRRRDGVKRKQPGSGGGREDTSSTEEEEEEEADGGPSRRGGAKRGRKSLKKLLHQPTVLLRRLDAAALSAADANTEDRREEKSTPKSGEGTPRRRGAEPSCSDDKENCHVLPGITTPTITEARPSAGDSDDVIGDSEDEATKNFKGMLFVKRYYKTKHDTYVPTLREFWKPWMVRPNLLSPR